MWLKYRKTHISYKKTENILGRLGKNKIEETNKFCTIKQQSLIQQNFGMCLHSQPTGVSSLNLRKEHIKVN